MTRPSVQDLALIVLMGLAVGHVAVLGWWIVDDAAISFAYSRSLAEGHGLVPYVGGEQVEGYSNPTWVVLIAVGQLFAIDPFSTAKALSFALVAATVPLVHALASRVRPEAGLPAAALFAANTQVAVFGSCGLENPLLWFLLTLGLLRVAHELDDGSAPWSAVVFALLGASRPEGLIYAVAVVPWIAFGTWRAGRGPLPVLKWLAVLLAPTVAYQLARYAWFGWAYPMTYYAKVHSGLEALVRWNGMGWRYLRSFVLDLGRGFALPVMLLGALGLVRWRWVLGGVVVAGILVGMPLYARWLGPVATVGLIVLALGLLIPIARSEGGIVRAMCWTVAIASTAFAIRAGGDWMSGFRWFAITAVPGAVLGGLGLVELALRVPARVGIAGTVAAIAAVAWVNVMATIGYRVDPETSAYMVGGRVRNARELLGRLQIRERPVCLTFDIGGFLWWSKMDVVDAMGLTDVPVAMNKQFRALFWDEYLLERRPHVMVQLGMRATADVTSGKVVGEQYIDLGRGNRVRRDLLFESAWSGADAAPIAFEDGVVVAGFDLAPTAEGDPVEIAVGLQSTAGASFTVDVVLADDAGNAIASWPVPPGHGMLATPLWKPDEVFHGRYTLGLPAALARGSYPLGIRVLSGGRALLPLPPAVVADDGVVWLGRRLEVMDEAGADAAAKAERERVLGLARDGRCEDADRASLVDAEALTARAACWIGRTDGDRIATLERARRLDPEAPGYAEAARPLADQRYAEGMRAREAGEVELAFQAFSEVMRLDPSRSRARRYAEEARTERLRTLRGPRPDE